MKKFLTIAAALALVLGLSQCKKPNVPEYTGPIDGKIIQKATLTASNGDNGAKVDMHESQVKPGELDLAWEKDDIVYAYDGFGNVSELTLVGDGGSSSGTFDGEITVDENITTDDYITFYYYGKNVDVQKAGTTTIDFSEQYGLLRNDSKTGDNAIKGKLIAYGTAKYNEAGIYENVNLDVPFAIAKLAFNSFSNANITVTCDKSMPVGYTISKDGEISYKYGAAKASSEMTFKEYDSSNPYYAVFVPTYEGSDPVEKEYTLRQGEKVMTLKAAFSGAYFTAGGTGGATVMVPTVNFGTPDLEWAVCNLGATNGATKESWYGNYYAWGETTAYNEVPNAYPSDWTGNTNSDYKTLVTENTPKTSYSWSNYKWGTPSRDGIIYKYTGDDSYGSTLNADDDAAHVVWGSDWRIPTKDEWQQLLDNNTFVYLTAGVEYNDVVPSFTPVTNGLLVVKGGKNSISLDNTKYMFLPAAGGMWNDELSDVGNSVCYPASSLRPNNNYSCCLVFLPGIMPSPAMDGSTRCFGKPVRPVR